MNVMVGKASKRYGGKSKQMHVRLGREDEHELHQPGGPHHKQIGSVIKQVYFFI
jgi:hypothetical protein